MTSNGCMRLPAALRRGVPIVDRPCPVSAGFPARHVSGVTPRLYRVVPMVQARDAGTGTATLARGVVVPYPWPSDEAATRIARANRRVDTAPERLLRSGLHRAGLRFRKDLPLRLDGLVVRPDVVFTRAKLAVFVDGCFWHSCPRHQHVPKRNRSYWVPKFAANRARDRRVDVALAVAGWRVVRIWEHDVPDPGVSVVVAALEGPRSTV